MIYIMFLFFRIHIQKDALSKKLTKQKHQKNKNQGNTFQV